MDEPRRTSRTRRAPRSPDPPRRGTLLRSAHAALSSGDAARARGRRRDPRRGRRGESAARARRGARARRCAGGRRDERTGDGRRAAGGGRRAGQRRRGRAADELVAVVDVVEEGACSASPVKSSSKRSRAIALLWDRRVCCRRGHGSRLFLERVRRRAARLDCASGPRSVTGASTCRARAYAVFTLMASASEISGIAICSSSAITKTSRRSSSSSSSRSWRRRTASAFSADSAGPPPVSRSMSGSTGGPGSRRRADRR